MLTAICKIPPFLGAGLVFNLLKFLILLLLLPQSAATSTLTTEWPNIEDNWHGYAETNSHRKKDTESFISERLPIILTALILTSLFCIVSFVTCYVSRRPQSSKQTISGESQQEFELEQRRQSQGVESRHEADTDPPVPPNAPNTPPGPPTYHEATSRDAETPARRVDGAAQTRSSFSTSLEPRPNLNHPRYAQRFGQFDGADEQSGSSSANTSRRRSTFPDHNLSVHAEYPNNDQHQIHSLQEGIPSPSHHDEEAEQPAVFYDDASLSTTMPEIQHHAGPSEFPSPPEDELVQPTQGSASDEHDIPTATHETDHHIGSSDLPSPPNHEPIQSTEDSRLTQHKTPPICQEAEHHIGPLDMPSPPTHEPIESTEDSTSDQHDMPTQWPTVPNDIPRESGYTSGSDEQ